MSKGSLRIKLESVTAFATAFLATDYLWYTQKPKWINSIVWARVLDSKDVSAKQQGELSGGSIRRVLKPLSTKNDHFRHVRNYRPLAMSRHSAQPSHHDARKFPASGQDL
jgi:hypothetical protein